MIDGDTVGKSPVKSQDLREPGAATPRPDRRGTDGQTESASLLSPADKSTTEEAPDGTVAGTLDSRG